MKWNEKITYQRLKTRQMTCLGLVPFTSVPVPARYTYPHRGSGFPCLFHGVFFFWFYQLNKKKFMYYSLFIHAGHGYSRVWVFGGYQNQYPYPYPCRPYPCTRRVCHTRCPTLVQIHAEVCIDIIYKSFNILFRGLIERNDGESRATTAERLEDWLVVFNSLTTITRSRDNDVSTTGQKAFNDLDANGTLAHASEKCVLVLEGCSWSGNFMKDIEVNTSKIAAIFPGAADFAFQV